MAQQTKKDVRASWNPHVKERTPAPEDSPWYTSGYMLKHTHNQSMQPEV